jgi:tetratricopeptide (TPR) repeat protein
MQIRPTYHSKLYRDFLALEPKDFHGLIRFYEQQEQAVGQLGDMEQYEMLFAYTNALFEVGAYRQFLAIVDQAILVSLDATYEVGEELKQKQFKEFLFRKAAAYIQTLQPARSEHVSRELLRIDPQHEYALLLLRKALRQQDTSVNKITRATAILLFGLSAIIILIEVLWIRPFYDMHTYWVELTRNLVFLSGVLILLGGEALTLWRAYRRSNAFLKKY